MNLIARVKNIMLTPDAEWRLIADESGDVRYLFTRYVAILALIPAVCAFIANSVFGVSVSVGTFRVPLVQGLINLVLGYLFAFVLVYAVALVIDTLAPSFRSVRDFPNALKLATYSFTPAWLAGIFMLIPGLRFLGILGLYGLYLLWTGLTPLLGTPRDRSLYFALSVVVATIVVMIVLAIVQGSIASIPKPS